MQLQSFVRICLAAVLMGVACPVWAAPSPMARCVAELDAGRPERALRLQQSWSDSRRPRLPGSVEPAHPDIFAEYLCRAELSLIYDLGPVDKSLYQPLLDYASSPSQRLVALAVGAVVERYTQQGVASRLLMDEADALAESSEDMQPAVRRRYEYLAAMNDLGAGEETPFARDVIVEFMRDLPRGHHYRVTLLQAQARVLQDDLPAAQAVRMQMRDECVKTAAVFRESCAVNLTRLITGYRDLRLLDKADQMVGQLDIYARKASLPVFRANARALQALLHLERQQLDAATREALQALHLMPPAQRDADTAIAVLELNLLVVDLLQHERGSTAAHAALRQIALQLARSATDADIHALLARYARVKWREMQQTGKLPERSDWQWLPQAHEYTNLLDAWHDLLLILHAHPDGPDADQRWQIARRFNASGDGGRADLVLAGWPHAAQAWTVNTLNTVQEHCVEAIGRLAAAGENDARADQASIVRMCQCSVRNISVDWGAFFYLNGPEAMRQQVIPQSFKHCAPDAD